MRAYLYIVGASNDPDAVRPSKVPFRIDDKEIFFGPCKKNLRELLRDKCLAGEKNDTLPCEDIYLIGTNNGKSPVRKVIWAGRITRIMTFGVACEALSGPRYEKMRTLEDSPLHVRPIFECDGRLSGYEHVSCFHEEDNSWVYDLVDPRQRRILLKGRTVRLDPGITAWKGFRRDACFLLENVFFAEGQGIDLDEELLEILRRAQPERKDTIDMRALFGRTSNNSIDGKRGRWLELNKDDAKDLIKLIALRSRGISRTSTDSPRPGGKC